MRHSTAIDPSFASDDASRWLTVAGRRRAERIAAKFVASGVNPPAQIISSPFARAVQTAEIFARHIDYQDAITTWASITPNHHDLDGIIFDIHNTDASSLMLSSHEPTVSRLVQQLSGAKVPFPTGAISVLKKQGDGFVVTSHFGDD